MIDLSFLTEAEQEAILKVLNRDAELKKAEEKRVQHLHYVADNENDFKYKSGLWFYEAKSRRHRDKIHGADLVRASIRKRKKPDTIELIGVMEPPDETEEDVNVKKEEGNQSSNLVGITSTEKESLSNGSVTPAKRQNPFNSESMQDSTNNNKTPDPSPQNGQVNGTAKTKAELMSSLSKYGVKLPYPELTKGSQISQKASASQTPATQTPVPKPRSLKTNSEPQERLSVSLKKEDSFNGTCKPRGILKRRSSSSSTDSESIRLSQNIESGKSVLSGSSVLKNGQNNYLDEIDSASDNSERLKQVRFSEKVHQRPPTPNAEPYNGKEIGEYGILEPGLSGDLNYKISNHHDSEEPLSEQGQYFSVDYGDSKSLQPNDTPESQRVPLSMQPPLLEVERNLVEPEEGISKTNDRLISPKTSHDISIELPTDESTGEEPLYASVKKTPKDSSSSQKKDKKPEVGLAAAVNSRKDELNSSNPQEDITDPTENSFPENNEKFKRMSQSVPTLLQDETDGRDTDSASESSFQFGRHKKSPSSLTNLSGSSGMASMSSVSGSVMSMYSGDFGNVDIRGSIEFSLDYVEQLQEFLIYIYQCKDLAAAEVKRQRSDPYVKAYLLPEKAKMGKRKTAVKKKTLSPVYNEILRYKIPKQSLLTQTLNLSVWHHDALGRNSFLGEVNVDLATWNCSNAPRDWHLLEPRTPAAGFGLENRGEMKLAIKFIPASPQGTGSKPTSTGEVHIWIKECLRLPMLRENKISSFVKCTVLPDTSRKSRQKTRTVDKTTSPIFNHTMVYDGFKEEDLREACVELTVWDHNRLSNHFLGGIRVGLGTGKSYGTAVDWMDSNHEESTMWEKMMSSPNTWIEGLLPLRMLRMAKLAK